MTSAALEAHRRRRLLHGVALFGLLLLVRAPLLLVSQPIDDEVVYAVAGAEMAAGGEIYLSAVERKPPLLLMLNAAIASIFGPWNGHGIALVATLWILATMGAVYIVAARLFDHETGWTAAALYAIYQQWFYWNNLAFNGEVMMNLPIACSLALVVGRRAGPIELLLTGALMAAAFLLKQPAGIAALPIALYLLGAGGAGETRSPRMVRTGLFVGGWVLALILTGAALYRRGVLSEAIYWTIGDHDLPHFFWGNALGHTTAFVFLCAPLVVGGWWAVTSTAWREHRRERDALIGLTIVSAIGAAASWRFYAHYYTAIVLPLGLLAAPPLVAAWRSRRLSRPLMAGWMAATIVLFAASHAVGLSRLPKTTAAGSYVREHTADDDRIFVWGRGTRIYIDARRRPASRYIATFPLTGRVFGGLPKDIDTSDRILESAWSNLQADFARHAPVYIVDMEVGDAAQYPVAHFPFLRDLLADSYSLEQVTPEGRVYRRSTGQ